MHNRIMVESIFIQNKVNVFMYLYFTYSGILTSYHTFQINQNFQADTPSPDINPGRKLTHFFLNLKITEYLSRNERYHKICCLFVHLFVCSCHKKFLIYILMQINSAFKYAYFLHVFFCIIAIKYCCDCQWWQFFSLLANDEDEDFIIIGQ